METSKRAGRSAFMTVWSVFLAGLLFGPFVASGSLAWHLYWVYLAVASMATLAHGQYVRRRNPELLERRKRIGVGTKTWDMVWNLLFWPFLISIPVTAGFGIRFGWPQMPRLLWPFGALVFVGGMALSAWAMGVNPHFEGTVRIQKEIGHRVVDSGPYRFVRHPGYVGLCLAAIGSGFLMLSWPGLIPASWTVVWIVLRTAMEDRALRRELDGYEEFTHRTRFRLLPGLW